MNAPKTFFADRDPIELLGSEIQKTFTAAVLVAFAFGLAIGLSVEPASRFVQAHQAVSEPVVDAADDGCPRFCSSVIAPAGATACLGMEAERRDDDRTLSARAQ